MWGQTIVEVQQFERGLLYEKGRYLKTLEPGRYSLWIWQHRRVESVDMRETSQVVEAQEILTSDKIGVRVSLIAQYRVSDPVAARHTVENYVTQLYQDLQLTLRESITGRTLEEVLKDREGLSTQLQTSVAPRAEQYGVTLRRVGVRDIVLPGVVRTVFLQEVEADLKGRASLVAARHETAAARAPPTLQAVAGESRHFAPAGTRNARVAGLESGHRADPARPRAADLAGPSDP
jgi:regulator of protease activity HflC (stomatin/prohibitin superfamily)